MSKGTIKMIALAKLLGGGGGGGGGGTEAPLNDVIFYDYDGKRVYSYSASEFANLSAMPANPAHEGLTAQGWNWSLTDAKAYVASYGKLMIGQMYITSDGKTRLYIHIDSTARSALPLYWYQTKSNGVSIDWGDGSAAETFEGSGAQNATHTYATKGDYVIAMTVLSGKLELGASQAGYSMLGESGGSFRTYLNCLRRVEVGDNVAVIKDYAFSYCCSLESFTMPSSVTIISSHVFEYCYGLESITIPQDMQNLGASTFNNCYALKSVAMPKKTNILGTSLFQTCSNLENATVPDTVTSFPVSAFYGCSSLLSLVIPEGVTSIASSSCSACHSLAKITVPSSVTSISSNAFSSAGSVKEYHFKRTAPPSLANINAFNNIRSDCVIYVPSTSVNDYKAADKWSTYADRIVGE